LFYPGGWKLLAEVYISCDCRDFIAFAGVGVSILRQEMETSGLLAPLSYYLFFLAKKRNKKGKAKLCYPPLSRRMETPAGGFHLLRLQRFYRLCRRRSFHPPAGDGNLRFTPVPARSFAGPAHKFYSTLVGIL